MKVAVIGLGKSHDGAPWADPGWQKWGLPWDAYAPRCNLLFEMHPLELVLRDEADRGGAAYLARLKEQCCAIMMRERHEAIRASVAYPLRSVIADVGDYFGSSPAYMVALAICERAEEIGLWGVDIGEKYDHQRPNLEYLIGFARGRGIKVTVAGGSLLTLRKHDSIGRLSVIYPRRYGDLAG